MPRHLLPPPHPTPRAAAAAQQDYCVRVLRVHRIRRRLQTGLALRAQQILGSAASRRDLQAANGSHHASKLELARAVVSAGFGVGRQTFLYLRRGGRHGVVASGPASEQNVCCERAHALCGDQRQSEGTGRRWGGSHAFIPRVNGLLSLASCVAGGEGRALRTGQFTCPQTPRRRCRQPLRVQPLQGTTQ